MKSTSTKEPWRPTRRGKDPGSSLPVVTATKGRSSLQDSVSQGEDAVQVSLVFQSVPWLEERQKGFLQSNRCRKKQETWKKKVITVPLQVVKLWQTFSSFWLFPKLLVSTRIVFVPRGKNAIVKLYCCIQFSNEQMGTQEVQTDATHNINTYSHIKQTSGFQRLREKSSITWLIILYLLLTFQIQNIYEGGKKFIIKAH